jgi:hypothetical protein
MVELVTKAVLIFVFIGQMVMLPIMLLLRPRKRIEWATLMKTLAFVIILLRALYVRSADSNPWPPHIDLMYWLFLGLLVVFFDVSVIIEWGKIFYDRTKNKIVFFFWFFFILFTCSFLLYYGIMG